MPTATDDVEVLQRISKKLFGSFCLGKCVSAALIRCFFLLLFTEHLSSPSSHARSSLVEFSNFMKDG